MSPHIGVPDRDVADYNIQTGNTSSNPFLAVRCWLTNSNQTSNHSERVVMWLKLSTLSKQTHTHFDWGDKFNRENQNERWQWEATNIFRGIFSHFQLNSCFCGCAFAEHRCGMGCLVYCLDARFPTVLKTSLMWQIAESQGPTSHDTFLTCCAWWQWLSPASLSNHDMS